uniref:Probable membrane transporter protein n=1 Tax=Thermodesulfobacterium geofontis TaxID=1295609 RepID=A0A7C4JRA6_9BACT
MKLKVEFWGQEFEANMIIGAIGGFLIAVASSLGGFGGGPFVVPLMTVIMGLPIYVVVGSSLLAIFFNTLMGSLRYFFFGQTDLLLFIFMAAGAVSAGFVGPRIAKRLSPVWVKRVAAIGIIYLGLKLLNVPFIP